MQPKLVKGIRIKNFKSVSDLNLELGRINVFIGENGAGKSNILEAIAFAAAASVEKIDNEFLASRGIRVTDPALMRSAFDSDGAGRPIRIAASLLEDDQYMDLEFELMSDNEPYPKWTATNVSSNRTVKLTVGEFAAAIRDHINQVKKEGKDREKEILNSLSELISNLSKYEESRADSNGALRFVVGNGLLPSNIATAREDEARREFGEFVIYSPENSALRTREREGQVLPLGINGEGLPRFLQVLSSDSRYCDLDVVKKAASMFEWYSELRVDSEEQESHLRVKDKFIAERFQWIDSRSTNEGFLFAVFYFSLFASEFTPRFFAVDNIDASLNPRLCEEMMKRIVLLAKQSGKQCIFTTHNPAILDGLDINDSEQRLFVVRRNRKGETIVRRFDKTPNLDRSRLSELFLAGLLGGIPKGF